MISRSLKIIELKINDAKDLNFLEDSIDKEIDLFESRHTENNKVIFNKSNEESVFLIDIDNEVSKVTCRLK